MPRAHWLTSCAVPTPEFALAPRRELQPIFLSLVPRQLLHVLQLNIDIAQPTNQLAVESLQKCFCHRLVGACPRPFELFRMRLSLRELKKKMQHE